MSVMEHLTFRSAKHQKIRLSVALVGVVILAATVLATGYASASTGPSWTVQSTPNPSGAATSVLNAVSCPSTSACTAVGSSGNAPFHAADVTLAERWSGSNWAMQTTPNPSGAASTVLNGVSCPSISACTAVGYYINASGVYVTLAERWNGSGWALQSTPTPSGAGNSLLNAVSCPSTSVCIAVGYYYNRADFPVTLAEIWNGSSWDIESTPNPSTSNNEFNGVSCPSTSVCTAVGEYELEKEVTLAERWDGSSWSLQPTPTGAHSSTLIGVSCASTSVCTAVGTYQNYAFAARILAERWNGSSWVRQSTPKPSGASVYLLGLTAVSCPSASICTAVGVYEKSSEARITFAEHWNTSSWALQSTRNPSATYNWFSGVSCSSTSVCTAAGTYALKSSYVTLAERHA
jgi:hypothetical protein